MVGIYTVHPRCRHHFVIAFPLLFCSFFVWVEAHSLRSGSNMHSAHEIAIRSSVAEQKIYCDNSDELIYAYTYFQSGGGAMRLMRE